MIGIFPDHDIGDQLLGRQPALDQPWRRRRLHHRARATPAGIFGPARDDHLILRRDHVEAFGAILADDMHRATAAWAGHVLGLDQHLASRQMSGQRTTALTLSFDTLPLDRRFALLLLGLGAGDRLFELHQGKSELTRINRLGALAKLHSLQLTDEVAQTVVLFADPLFLRPFRGELAADAGQFGALRRQRRLLRYKRGAQRIEIGQGRHSQGLRRPSPSAQPKNSEAFRSTRRGLPRGWAPPYERRSSGACVRLIVLMRWALRHISY